MTPKTITLTDFRRNFERYIDEAESTPIVITKYGREYIVAVPVTIYETITCASLGGRDDRA